MATSGKRKADDTDSNGIYQNDEPILKRRDTSVSGFQNLNLDGNEHQNQQHEARTDSASSTQNDSNIQPTTQDTALLPTPPNSATLPSDEFMNDDATTPLPHQVFQSRLTTFCQTHGYMFGPAYLSDLQKHHQQATETSTPGIVLSAGQAFARILDSYIGDLQAAALQQVQLRATMASVGVEKAALEAVDVVLAKLDQQISVVGAEAQNLDFDL